MKPTPRHACELCAHEGPDGRCPCRCADCRAAEVERRRALNAARREVWGEK